MKCNNCGGDIEQGWGFCPNCSISLSVNPSTENKVPVSGIYPLKSTYTQDGIIIDKSTQTVNVAEKVSPPGFAKNITVQDGVVIDKSCTTVNVNNIYQSAPVEIKIPGKYSMTLFQDSGPYFPAYRATLDSKNFVAKKLDNIICTEDLNRFIKQNQLDTFPKGIARYLISEEFHGEVFLMREFCLGESLATYIKKWESYRMRR